MSENPTHLDELLNFDGRLDRLEFLGFTLLLWLVVGIATFIAIIIISLGGGTIASFFGVALLLGILLFGIVANVSLHVRRLHDLNQSGKWAALLFVPFLGFALLLVCLL